MLQITLVCTDFSRFTFFLLNKSPPIPRPLRTQKRGEKLIGVFSQGHRRPPSRGAKASELPSDWVSFDILRLIQQKALSCPTVRLNTHQDLCGSFTETS